MTLWRTMGMGITQAESQKVYETVPRGGWKTLHYTANFLPHTSTSKDSCAEFHHVHRESLFLSHKILQRCDPSFTLKIKTTVPLYIRRVPY